jgi:hypothetical protein
MKVSILISLACWISLLTACASSTQKSILEERAGYGINAPSIGINGSGGVHYVPTRVPEKVVVAWLHAHEMPSTDYFWGSWLSIVVAPEGWEMVKVDVPQSEKRKIKTQDRPTIKPLKRLKTSIKSAT